MILELAILDVKRGETAAFEAAFREAQAIIARATRVGDTLLVAEALDGWDAQGLKAIAVAATAVRPDAVVALFGAHLRPEVVDAEAVRDFVGRYGPFDLASVEEHIAFLAETAGSDQHIHTALSALRELLAGGEA